MNETDRLQVPGLATARDFVHTILDTLPDPVFVKDRQHRWVLVNQAFADFIGRPRDALLGKTDHDFVSREEADVFWRVDDQVFATGVANENEESFTDSHGEVHWLSTKKALVRDAAGNEVLVGVIRDITLLRKAHDQLEQRVLERTAALRESEAQLRQSQKMEAIGRLAGGVAHDFNNLLLVITGSSELARSQLPDGHRVRQLLDEVLSAAMQAAGLTRQLLTFSRQQVVQPRLVDLNGLVRDGAGMLRRVLGEDLQLDTVLAPELGQVRVDAAQMLQVMINLAVNARDAMPDGGVLTITTENIGASLVRLSVRDTGVGMDSSTQARLFEPFFTTKPPGKGTGLGLSTVYGIIQQSGGTIAVESALGQGTTFRIELPRVEGQNDGQVDRLAHRPQGTETILVVDDDRRVLSVVRQLLEAHGYRVLAADTATEALQLATDGRHRIDVLVTDLVMPMMPGKVVANRVLALHPRAGLVFMSGYSADALAGDDGLRERAAFLQKPFSEDVLLRTVRAALASQLQVHATPK